MAKYHQLEGNHRRRGCALLEGLLGLGIFLAFFSVGAYIGYRAGNSYVELECEVLWRSDSLHYYGDDSSFSIQYAQVNNTHAACIVSTDIVDADAEALTRKFRAYTAGTQLACYQFEQAASCRPLLERPVNEDMFVGGVGLIMMSLGAGAAVLVLRTTQAHGKQTEVNV